jgi:hypothetical protein
VAIHDSRFINVIPFGAFIGRDALETLEPTRIHHR